MANYITIGHEFINLDRVDTIQVFSDTSDTVIVQVETEDWAHEIPCAGTEDEVRAQIKRAIERACGSCEKGPMSP